MGSKKLQVCDGCGLEQEDTVAVGWLNVRTLVTSLEEYHRLLNVAQALPEDVHSKVLVDAGDFHSLACLANWASAQSNMRALDRENLDG